MEKCDCDQINIDKMDIETYDGSEFRIIIKWCSKCQEMLEVEEY